MNWAHNEVKLDWVKLIENVSQKWVSTKCKQNFFFFLGETTMLVSQVYPMSAIGLLSFK